MIQTGELPAEVSIVKIDTEGHDLSVVRGMGDLACDIVMVEHWEDLPLGLGVFYLDAANERLALVEELQATGQERQREFEASQAGAQAYADAASERLALVNELHATAQEQQLKLDALNRQRA